MFLEFRPAPLGLCGAVALSRRAECGDRGTSEPKAPSPRRLQYPASAPPTHSHHHGVPGSSRLEERDFLGEDRRSPSFGDRAQAFGTRCATHGVLRIYVTLFRLRHDPPALPPPSSIVYRGDRHQELCPSPTRTRLPVSGLGHSDRSDVYRGPRLTEARRAGACRLRWHVARDLRAPGPTRVLRRTMDSGAGCSLNHPQGSSKLTTRPRGSRRSRRHATASLVAIALGRVMSPLLIRRRLSPSLLDK